MATLAAKSPRADLIFDPFPLVFHPDNKAIKVLDPQKKDISRARSILDKFPSMEQISNSNDLANMRSRMDKADPCVFPLFQWIINSNQSHIVKLTPQQYIKTIQTPHQYLLLSATAETENIFLERKKQNGSEFAFHGSPIENWHSIMRNGLKNASGSKLQMNGAAFGAGIYLSPNATTSLGYCRATHAANRGNKSGNRFIDSENVFCMALCEVIKTKATKSGGIWVVPKADDVCTRFFFVFPMGFTPSGDTQDPSFVRQIQTAMEFYGL
eukprot:TRINITY_DN1505_c0_g1_i3.p1 TRINITY_DN1505_c0_g1~~TRINITY_DN1505_c0_g1_i3.p1  ORF type:complete len:269 (+),score=71.07 TRINITY_DN1505_c0_g1_i3:258-1064(+)